MNARLSSLAIPLLLATLIAALCPSSAGSARAADADFVPFVIPPTVHAKTQIDLSPAPIRDAGDRIVVKDGHFWRRGKRFRVWGVNMCFGGCFPSHEDARQIAHRMAAAGVNSVRFHHMDSRGYPGGIWDRKDPTKLSSEALDRLDFFIDQLAKRGIYANINLHVSRTHSRVLGLPKPPTSYDKMVDIFTPQLIDAQKRYARMLLSHANPYRPGKCTYAQDPAVSFVEITNEDSLFMWGAANTLQRLPAFYAEILQRLYVTWLEKQYATTDAMKKAWGAQAVPLGENLLAPLAEGLAKGAERPWRVEQHQGCQAAAKPLAGGGVRLEIAKANDTNWHLQFNQSGLAVKEGQYYTLTFRAKADKPRELYINVGRAHEPWGYVGLARTVKLTDKAQTFRMGFAATDSDDNVRVNFAFGGTTVAVELSDVAFQPGGRVGLAEGESLEKDSVALFGTTETPGRARDRMRFLAETEKAYFDDMRSFIRKDLGCGALVTGTIVFGPLGLWAQSDMDFIDGHSYWHHPRFPGRPWDPGNWLIDQSKMVDRPDQATVNKLSAQRLAGKPYTVSEYNHPAPQDGQAECVPLLAAWAATQDWDGIWFFTYSHSNKWDRDRMSSFFDFCGNPAKWGFMPSGAVMFRDFGLGPLRHGAILPLSRGKETLGELADLHLTHDRDMLAAASAVTKGFTLADLRRTRLYVDLSRKAYTDDVPPGPGAKDVLDYFAWSVSGKGTSAKGRVAMMGDRAGLLIGPPIEPTDRPNGVTAPAFSVLTIASLDGQPVDRSRRLLITACGRCENVDMGFSEDRRTVGRNWGKPPVRIEAVTAGSGSLDPDDPTWQCHALKPDGTLGPAVPNAGKPESPRFALSPKYKTMWYLLTRKGKKEQQAGTVTSRACRLSQCPEQSASPPSPVIHQFR